MKNQEIANAFNEIANLLILQDSNPFRIRAYRKAAQNIEAMGQDIADLSKAEKITIPGIGKDLESKIEEYIHTGTMQMLEENRKKVPYGLLKMLAIPGMGPKTVKLVYEKLSIDNLKDLKKAAENKKLEEIPGIQHKTEENILRGIEMLQRTRERKPIGKILPIAEDIAQKIKDIPGTKNVTISGSLRRWEETIKDIDILATSETAEKVMDKFVHLPEVKEILMHGPTRSSVVLENALQVDLRIVGEDSFGAALQYFTGNKPHNIHIRKIAIKKGLKINEYGIFKEPGDIKIDGRKEESIYKTLGLPFIPPELRTDTGEIEAAQKNKLPSLINPEDIKGDLHIHSKWSDGHFTIEEMALKAQEMGYEYIAITDHSQHLGVAGGLTPKDLIEQKKEIDALNKKFYNFKIFTGTEVDILNDGSPDFPDEVLKELDFVIASIHSGFQQSKEQLTKRIIRATTCPYVHAIGHLTGRLIGEREAYEVDFPKICKAAQETNTALEINAYPQRLDINDRLIREAKKYKIKFTINTDAHYIDQLRYMRYGVSMARRGWLETGDVINTMGRKSLEKLFLLRSSPIPSFPNHKSSQEKKNKSHYSKN